MSKARLKRGDVVEEILGTWGDWRRTVSAGQGWGGGADVERMPKAPGGHADPLFSEYINTHEGGYGLVQHIDSLVREMYPAQKGIMRRRYVKLMTFQKIGQQMKVEEHIVREMHKACVGLLTTEIVRYVMVGSDRRQFEHWARDLKSAA